MSLALPLPRSSPPKPKRTSPFRSGSTGGSAAAAAAGAAAGGSGAARAAAVGGVRDAGRRVGLGMSDEGERREARERKKEGPPLPPASGPLPTPPRPPSPPGGLHRVVRYAAVGANRAPRWRLQRSARAGKEASLFGFRRNRKTVGSTKAPPARAVTRRPRRLRLPTGLAYIPRHVLGVLKRPGGRRKGRQRRASKGRACLGLLALSLVPFAPRCAPGRDSFTISLAGVVLTMVGRSPSGGEKTGGRAGRGLVGGSLAEGRGIEEWRRLHFFFSFFFSFFFFFLFLFFSSPLFP